MAKIAIEGDARELLARLLQSELRRDRDARRFGGHRLGRGGTDHLAKRVPFPREHEGPGAGSLARLTRFSARPRPLERYQPNLPTWW